MTEEDLPSPAPVAVSKAPADTKFFVTKIVTLPYTKADFDDARQDKYKTAVAAAAGTIAENVDIVTITEKRRRAGSIDVETKIRANNQAELDAVTSSLGSGDNLKTKLNTELKAQGLAETTSVSNFAQVAENVSIEIIIVAVLMGLTVIAVGALRIALGAKVPGGWLVLIVVYAMTSFASVLVAKLVPIPKYPYPH